MISAEVEIVAQFYELDPMQVVWHGNYAKFLERARCALLDKIGYNYPEMNQSGFLWPIVDMQIKYVRPIRYAQAILVLATLVEYENRLKISYRCHDKITGEVLTKAHTTQVAVDAATGELCLESPAFLIDKIRSFL
ncbi:acyl-CoA thioesterase [Dongia soli]|uniref:Thioesterase family protein n=1 Tax=Dongia soli TaxID=600628 RepID=A0ABU5EFN9_9PROT|nr:thioesterase family protein [Dongia soli]MDY0885223.1 thioesterase family protein [Dongia soli]